MPAELASEAGAAGSLARAVSKAALWAAFMGLSGSSAQARWLMTSSIPMPASRSGVAARAAISASINPRRDMPVSILIAAGRPPFARPWAAQRSICPGVDSTGIRSWASISASAPSPGPASTKMRAVGVRPASSPRSAAPSSTLVMKNVRQPAAAKARAMGPSPSP